MFKKTVKILLIGDTSVGKSAILRNYCGDEFQVNFMPTIGIDFKVKTYVRKGENVKLQIWDTAGQERFRAITAAYYRGAHGVLVVYDITDPESFENVKRWLENVQHIPKVLIGNKSDLEQKRKVSCYQGQQLAEKINIPFYETSAKTGQGVKKAFETLIDLCDLTIPEPDVPITVRESSEQNECCWKK